MTSVVKQITNCMDALITGKTMFLLMASILVLRLYLTVFLLSINSLYDAIECCKVNRFAGEANCCTLIINPSNILKNYFKII